MENESIFIVMDCSDIEAVFISNELALNYIQDCYDMDEEEFIDVLNGTHEDIKIIKMYLKGSEYWK